jgi:hypothetical protein
MLTLIAWRSGQLRLAGFEPATYGLGNRWGESLSTESNATCDDLVFVLADCLAFLEMEIPVADLRMVMEVAERRQKLIRVIEADDALIRIVTAWPHLPEPIRRAMLALVS